MAKLVLVDARIQVVVAEDEGDKAVRECLDLGEIFGVKGVAFIEVSHEVSALAFDTPRNPMSLEPRALRRQTLEIEVIWPEDGQGDDWGTLIGCAIYEDSRDTIYRVKVMSDTILIEKEKAGP